MRLLKQILYGGLFLIILTLIVWWIVGLLYTPNPTCFDNRKNQGETQTDCGGPCISCEVKALKDIVINKKSIVVNGDGTIGIAVELMNQNSTWGAQSFQYLLTIKDSFGSVLRTITDETYIYAGELKYIAVPRVDNVDASRVASIDIIIQNVQWISQEQFKKPDIEVQDTRTRDEQGVFVSAKLYNKDIKTFSRVGVVALVFNRTGTLIGVGQTFLDTLPTVSAQEVRVVFSRTVDIYRPIVSATIQFPRTLKQGDTGEDVKNLQSVLMEQGLYTGVLSGFFDTDTVTSTRALQIKNNITPTGELDEKTKIFLNTMLQSETPQQTTQEKDTSIDTTKTKIFINAKR